MLLPGPLQRGLSDPNNGGRRIARAHRSDRLLLACGLTLSPQDVATMNIVPMALA